MNLGARSQPRTDSFRAGSDSIENAGSAVQLSPDCRHPIPNIGGGGVNLPGLRLLCHADRFYVYKLADSVSAQLAPVAGPLHAAKRHTRVRGHHPVDEDHAGFDLLDELLLLRFV